jgi:hypothetical protein
MTNVTRASIARVSSVPASRPPASVAQRKNLPEAPPTRSRRQFFPQRVFHHRALVLVVSPQPFALRLRMPRAIAWWTTR